MADDEEFWKELVEQERRADAERATGLRMPEPAAPVIDQRMPEPASSSTTLTSKQLAFALCLGLELKPTDNTESISKRIDHTKARADGYRVNKMQQALAQLLHVDIEDCDTRSDAAWILWDEFKEDEAEFFYPIDANFQQQFCGGSISRYLSEQPRTSTAKPTSNRVTICANCHRPVSSLAILCPECGKAVRTGDQHVPWPAVIACGIVAGIVWWIIDLLQG